MRDLLIDVDHACLTLPQHVVGTVSDTQCLALGSMDQVKRLPTFQAPIEEWTGIWKIGISSHQESLYQVPSLDHQGNES